ncbi:hypothetical protein L914_06156 [Phytophthora nicotianae]|uniref:BED-type domain-containing protein n=1 Tax=Phytophthora nicotianae TaxID=4792 RepID=W2NM12_PHYNI|nr:hypothetical protein L914_06157 [Phytophthora nicotianae]ETM49645.1 hypothetical protein L914_06156 [Phytophthora nicotianae]
MANRSIPAPTSRQLCAVLFEERDDRYYCRLCPLSRAKPRNGGFTSVIDHLNRNHRGVYLDEYYILARRPNALDNYVRVTVDGAIMNRYHWMDWVIMEHHELSFCEKPRARKYTSLEPISRYLLKQDLDSVEVAVQARVRQRLSGKPFGFLLDAWTEAGTHYAAIIAVTSSASDAQVGDKFLLVFSTFADEGDRLVH